MVTDAEEILGEKKKTVQENIFDSFDGIENTIIKLLKIEALSIDELCQKTGLSIAETNTKITLMSLNNFIFEENGKIYLKS